MGSEWKITTIGDFCPFKYGKGLPEKKRNSVGSVKVYGSNGPVGLHDQSLVNKPGIVIGRKGTVGSVHFASEPFWPIDTTFYVTSEPGRDLQYTYYLLKTIGLEAMNADSAVPGLNRNAAHAQEILIPEYNEQRAIAHILGSLDDKIELNRRMNETLEQMAQAIFKSWFVDFDPVRDKSEGRDPGLPEEIAELFPDGFEESEIGEVPRGWEVVRLPDIVKKYIDNRGKTPPTLEDGIPLLEVKHLPDNQMKPDLNTSKYVSEETYDSWFRSHLKSYDIILSTVGTIGRICIVPPNSKFVIAQNLLGIRFNDEFVTPIFMYYQMSSEKFKNDVDARLVITVQKSIKRKDLITIPLLKPPLNIQRAFDRMVSSNVLFQLPDENITLSKIRDTLLPKLISGELRVPDAENLVLESTI